MVNQRGAENAGLVSWCSLVSIIPYPAVTPPPLLVNGVTTGGGATDFQSFMLIQSQKDRKQGGVNDGYGMIDTKLHQETKLAFSEPLWFPIQIRRPTAFETNLHLGV